MAHTLTVRSPRATGSKVDPESRRQVAARIAEKAGVPEATAYRWVRGHGVMPDSWGKLRDAAEALGYQVEVKDGGAP